MKRLELEEDTLVVFTSDNGPWASKGENGGESGPLRGSKGSTWEGGVREPTIVRWPGKISPGTSSDAIAGTTDLLPTIVALAGGETKTGRKIDGHDISPILLGEVAEIPDRAWHYYRGNRLEAVRRGPWKLDLVDKAPGMGIPKPGSMTKKLPSKEKKAPFRPHLYHLGKDIGETNDLAADNPEVVAELQTIADAMAADIGNGQPGPGVRPSGTVENPVTLYPTEPRKKSPAIVPARGMSPIEWMAVKAGENYTTFSAPEIGNKSFTIEASITPDSDKANGVIVAHGGSQVGYSLHLNNGHAVFAIRFSSEKIVTVKSTKPLSGKTDLHAQLNGEGAMILKIGGDSEVKAVAGSLISKQPQENLCVGHDDKNTVVDHGEAGTKLQAKIHQLEVKSQSGL